MKARQRLVVVQAVLREDGLWVAWSEDTDPLVVASGESEDEALMAVRDELEAQWGRVGEYVGPLYG
jgi:hypothetical protein